MKLAAALSLLALLAGPARALPFNFEMRELVPELGLVVRDVYVCSVCTLEQFEAIVPPAGWQKATARVGLWDSGTFDLPTPPPGVAPNADFVPELPGEEFFYVARVLDAAAVGSDPDLGALVVAHVQRSTTQTFDAGRVLHEVTDADGNLYVLLTFDYALSESAHDLHALDSLADLGLPPDWSYDSRILSDPFTIDSAGLATVFVQGDVATYQLVPEPGSPLLLCVGALTWLGTGRLRRPPRSPKSSG